MSLRRALLVLLIANTVAASPALSQLLGDLERNDEHHLRLAVVGFHLDQDEV